MGTGGTSEVTSSTRACGNNDSMGHRPVRETGVGRPRERMSNSICAELSGPEDDYQGHPDRKIVTHTMML